MDIHANVAQPLAPEDIAPGHYVTPLTKMQVRFPNLYSDDAFVDKAEPLRLTYVPRVRAPARVLEICLPFVLIETPKGKTRMIDLRRYRLARVSDRFGQAMFNRAKSAPPPTEGKPEEDTEDVLVTGFE